MSTVDQHDRAEDAVHAEADRREAMALSGVDDDAPRCTLFACGNKPGPAHGPCREHGAVHCSADSCF